MNTKISQNRASFRSTITSASLSVSSNNGNPSQIRDIKWKHVEGRAANSLIRRRHFERLPMPT